MVTWCGVGVSILSIHVCTPVSMRGIWCICYVSLVAGSPTLMSLEQTSPDSVRVIWSPPSAGATVTGYVVHYKTATSVRTKSVAQFLTSSFLTGLTHGFTYTISVEATSQHLSGESEEMNITLGE